MRWSTGNRDNIDDRRGASGMGMKAGGLGIGGLLLLLLLSWATGTDFLSLVGGPGGSPESARVGAPTGGPVATSPEEEKLVDMVDAIMEDVQRAWTDRLGNRYERTKTVLFRDAIQSACGMGESATGPFYCPGDHQVYLDLGFFNELERLGAAGDFAQAYVLAHELGHHVQTLLGIEDRVRAQQRGNRAAANELSVKMELQADCFAGVWGHDASQAGRAAAGQVELDPGDAEEGLRAAASIGDDRLQRMSTGHVSPERFTHGTSEQRAYWFKRGLTSGSIDQCNTFDGGGY